MRRLLGIACCLVVVPAALAAQALKETVDGIRNFTVVDAVVGCAGATESRAFPALKARGLTNA